MQSTQLYSHSVIHDSQSGATFSNVIVTTGDTWHFIIIIIAAKNAQMWYSHVGDTWVQDKRPPTDLWLMFYVLWLCAPLKDFSIQMLVLNCTKQYKIILYKMGEPWQLGYKLLSLVDWCTKLLNEHKLLMDSINTCLWTVLWIGHIRVISYILLEKVLHM